MVNPQLIPDLHQLNGNLYILVFSQLSTAVVVATIQLCLEVLQYTSLIDCSCLELFQNFIFVVLKHLGLIKYLKF